MIVITCSGCILRTLGTRLDEIAPPTPSDMSPPPPLPSASHHFYRYRRVLSSRRMCFQPERAKWLWQAAGHLADGGGACHWRHTL